MSKETKRILLFLIGCMGTRFTLVYLSKTQLWLLPLMGILAIIPAIGFITIYMFGLRRTGAEVFGEKIWWNNLRPLHGLLWGLFAYLALTGNKNAWVVLLIDTLIGLFSFMYFHGFLK